MNAECVKLNEMPTPDQCKSITATTMKPSGKKLGKTSSDIVAIGQNIEKHPDFMHAMRNNSLLFQIRVKVLSVLFPVKHVWMEYAYAEMELLVRLTLYNRMVMIGDITSRAMFGVMPQQGLVSVTTRN